MPSSPVLIERPDDLTARWLTDAVGATSQAEHANAITYDYPMFSKPIATADFVAAMSGDAVSADTSRGY